MIWEDIRDPNSPKLDELAKQYNLHPLHIEDCRHRNQSAKVEEQGDYLFIVVKPIRMDDDFSLNIIDFDIFLGKDFIITVQEADCPELNEELEKIKKMQATLRPDQAMHRILDAVVDSYLPILDRINDRIDETEDEVLTNPDPAMLQRIFDMKRELIELRRVLTNMRDVTGHLQRTETDIIARDMLPFLRDVYDHVARNLDIIEMQRDLVNGSLDIYLSSVANRTNQVMKVLTIMGTLALPALVISGIYGMNIKNLPWADSPHAVYIVFAMIVASCATLLWMFRKYGWY
jgi:magnesium transporter